MLKERNIALCIVLSIITCGIYGLYWLYNINNDMCSITPDDPFQPNGGMVILLSIVTCGIYAIFWMYKMGQKMDDIKGDGSNNTVMFLVLTILGLGIVCYCIMQNELNIQAQKNA